MSQDRHTSLVDPHTFPATDAVFKERVGQILREIGKTDPKSLVGELVRRLRAVHPEASATIRGGLAGLDDATIVYVYRDGAVKRDDAPERWMEDPATARVVSGPDGQYLDANDAAAQLFGVERDEILRRSAGDFTRLDTRVDGAVLWKALAERGRLHSLAVIACPDGRERHVEFLTIRDGDGPGRNVTYLRALG